MYIVGGYSHTMPRPLRIEYENAYYYVMNRGRGRQAIFHSSAYYHAFMTTLQEANRRFNTIVHCFCLMQNHYHLLLQTPNANLGRIMRHINSVYTQRYNRLKKTDGPLFRGRYKAIVIDEDVYLLQLSRYIHRNPIEVNTPLVKQLAKYPWSSYPAYIGKPKSPDWLSQNQVYDLLSTPSPVSAYKKYVEQEVGNEKVSLYENGNKSIILGDKYFQEKVLTLNRKKITEQQNLARKMAYYLIQTMCDLKLKEIATLFGINHVGSASTASTDIKHQIRRNKHLKKILELALEMIKVT